MTDWEIAEYENGDIRFTYQRTPKGDEAAGAATIPSGVFNRLLAEMASTPENRLQPRLEAGARAGKLVLHYRVLAVSQIRAAKILALLAAVLAGALFYALAVIPAHAEEANTWWAMPDGQVLEVPMDFARTGAWVVECESHYDADAVNPKTGAFGWWGIMPLHLPRMRALELDPRSVTDQTRYALVKYREEGWRPWASSQGCWGWRTVDTWEPEGEED